MKPILLTALALLLACGPADDAGREPPRSTGAAGAGAAGTPELPAGGPATAPEAARPTRVVFIGTSLTAGLGLLREEERFTERLEARARAAGIPVQIANAGVSGDTSAGGLRRIDWVLQEPADVLVVELGANDGLRGQSVEALRENLEQLIVRAQELSPGVRVVLVGMEAPPNLGERYTSAFRAVYPDLAREHGAVLVPFLLDGVAGDPSLNQQDRIHPNAEGHAAIAELLWPHLEPVLREAALSAGARP